MAQAPATPKTLRALRRALAPLGLGGIGRPAPSETAALALRADRRPLRAPGGVVFIVPLVGPAQVGDWAAVEARLQATLRSFMRQSDNRWQAVICCQERPALPADPRLRHLPFDDPRPGNDKWRKLAALVGHLPELDAPAGLVMSFDADDLAHPDLVATMLGSPVPGGWLVQSGYVRDAATGDVALAGPPRLTKPLRKPFWKLCGSCAALRYDLARPGTLAALGGMVAHEHRMFPYLAALMGQPLTPLPFPAAMYELNHGENFGARRGRVGFKTRFVQRFRIGNEKLLREIARLFDV